MQIKSVNNNLNFKSLVNRKDTFTSLDNINDQTNNNIPNSQKVCDTSIDTENLELDLDSNFLNQENQTDVLDVNDSEINDVSEVDATSIKEQLEGLKENLDTKINELSDEVATLEDEYNTYMLNIQNPIPFMQDTNDDNLEKAKEIEEKLEPLKQELMTMEALKKQLDHAIELSPYTELYKTSDFIDFINNYSCDYQNLDYELLQKYNYDVSMYINELSRGHTADELKGMHINEIDEFALIEYILKNKPNDVDSDYAIRMNPYLSDIYKKYKYMTEDEIMMYHYLFKTEGKDKADDYLNLINDDINQAAGTANALEFLNSLDLNDEGDLENTLKNLFGVSGKGLADGIDNFFDGIANVIQNNGQLTAEDYEKMIILSYLAENSSYHDKIYEFTSSLGNMLPAMVASAIATFIATPAGGATIAGITLTASNAGAITASSLMGLSAMGNAKHQALVEGSGVLSSTLYGLFVGLSEATLGYFLGKIPGISQTAGFTLKDLLQEGTEEYLQDWVDAGLQAVILGKDIDWSQVPEEAANSFIMGVLMAGFLNGGQQIVNITINGVNNEINVEQILEYMHDNNETDAMKAIEALNPSLFELFFNEENIRLDTLSDQEIMDKLFKLSKNNIKKLPKAIEKLLGAYSKNGRDNAILKQICRVSIEVLKANGYTAKDATTTVGILYYKILQKIGFQTYTDPSTGIKLNILNGTDLNNQKIDLNDIMDKIHNLPPEFLSIIKKLNFFDTFNPYDYYWNEDYKISDFGALATGGQGEINLWNIDVWGGDQFSLSVFVHEAAHSADTIFALPWGVETSRISDSKMWKDAMQSDLQTTGLTGVTDYAREAYAGNGKLTEDFAESVSLYYTNPNALDAFPARKAILEHFFPRAETVATAFDEVYDIMVNKYGQEEAEARLKYYYDIGDINIITNDGNARDKLAKYTLREYREFIEQTGAIKTDNNY